MSSAIIIIPCYNEEKRLNTYTFKEFFCETHSIKFIFVNDGSTDRTLEFLENLNKSEPHRFMILNSPRNAGKAEAVRKGLLIAFDIKPNYVGYWDADLSTPLPTISTFCDLLDARPDLEMVFGARVNLLGRAIKRRAMRHYAGRVFATAASLVLGIGIYDTQCGAKLFRSSSATELLFQKPFMTRWLIDVEMLARLIQTRRGTNLRQAEDVIYEFPLYEWHDITDSKIQASDFPKATFQLAAIYWKYLMPGRLPPRCG